MFIETNRRRYTDQQPAKKSARSPDDKSRINWSINRWSTELFVPLAVYIAFPLFVLPKRRFEQFFKVRSRAREALGFKVDRNFNTLFCPASPCPAVRPAPCRRDPPVVCPGLGLDRFPDMFCMKKIYREKSAVPPFGS